MNPAGVWPQSSDVGRKGRPRLPLKSFLRRRSLELFLRRIIAGATRFPAWRRALRPASQSSHEMGLSAGIEGIFRFKFTGNLSDQCSALVKNTILAGLGKSGDFAPVNFKSTSQSGGDKFACTVGCLPI